MFQSIAKALNGIGFYNLSHVLGFVVMIVFVALMGKKHGLPWWKAVLVPVVFFPLLWVIVLLTTWVENRFRNFGANNIVRGFAYGPLLVLIVAKGLRVDWNRAGDICAFSPCIPQIFGKLGCTVTGCCYGYPCAWGPYNPQTGTHTFPVQLCECLTCVVITAVLYLMARKRGFKASGTLYPAMLLMFGLSRVVWEFFRDNDKLFWGLSDLSLHALFMALVGAVWLLLRCRKMRRCKMRRRNLRHGQSEKEAVR